MENQNKIERLAELFRLRDQVESEIKQELGMPDSLNSQETKASPESRPKRKYKRKEKPLIVAKRRGRPPKEKEEKEVFRYRCLECDHTWTSFNDPNGESRDICPKCGSKLASW